ncbi:hypothetical protein JJL56_14255 [Azospirillum sp. YIM DDC1]|uniref:Uncharacterized protein n=1 Tax=Azospirillum aestuarii TaxID=2802052 RepID=A0ABS1HYY2_9PROT|nr:hypothetical protein [Azospirillum aestuarii]MBK3775292.1 hypothetical protein [Azospirillum brasilense]MBK4720033.1 hypothetical protein [Azospirillum aestuarii]TWA89795.1 hypothetical protein FBY14_10593 [Azospirillum brasilense]
MFRPKLILGPVLALALVALAACADAPGRSSGAAVGGAPAASTTAPTTAPAASRPARGVEDPSLRLDGGVGSDDSCRAQCERSNNSCMDSVAARTQSGLDRPDRGGIFSPSDNCQHSLRMCYQRCGAPTNQ